MSEAYYVKRGRRYIPAASVVRCDDYTDMMKVGTWRMVYAYSDGGRRYSYGVTPDTASFMAACELAAEAMERAIADKAKPHPSQQNIPYTKKQLAIIERFRNEMAEAGGLMPTWWQHSSARDIAQAGIDAVMKWKK